MTVKDIFLDIAFFFVGKEKDEAVWVFESCGFFPHNGILILLERCLLTVDENNKFVMHNLIQGWEVIQQESQEPGKRKRLICQGNAFELFKYQQGTDKIEGLILDLSLWTQRDLSTNIFEMMPKLRLLEIANAPHDLKLSFENSFQELRCIRWHYCPWTRLPSDFCPQKLIILNMQFSNFKTLWKGSPPLMNLRSINVSWSKCLKTIPNFDKVKKLEKLSLRCCSNLLKLKQSFLRLSKLSHLDLGKCQNLKRLPQKIGQLDGLRNLDLGGCHILKGLPDSIKQLTGLSELCLRECYNLTHLPESVADMKGLEVLASSYINIEQLPDSICQLRNLYRLNLNLCNKLKHLPEQIGNMKALRTLDAGESAIRQLPDSIEDLINLSYLRLRDCRNLKRLPKQLGKMQCLEILDASNTAIEELPDSIAQLCKLRRLELSGCEKLGEIPPGIWNLTSLTSLELVNRKGLKSLPDSIKNLKRLVSLGLTCNIRSCLPRISFLSSLTYLNLTDTADSFSSSIKLFRLSNLSKLEELRLVRCMSLGSCLPELPPNLEWLEVERCESLEQLPDLSPFIRLTFLLISGCNTLQLLPLLPPCLATLYIRDCRSIQDTHDHLTTLTDLRNLEITKCSNLIFNAEESFFQVLRSSRCDAVIPTREIPDWVGNRIKGSEVECVVPRTLSPNKSLHVLFWVVYNGTTHGRLHIRAIITNKTGNSTHNYDSIFFQRDAVGSVIKWECLEETYSSGDRLTVSFEASEVLNKQNLEVSYKSVKLENYGIHFMYR